MEGLTEDMWSPYKKLQQFIAEMLSTSSAVSLSALEMCLKKSKHTFATLLKNPPRNERNRNNIIKSINEGLVIPGQSHHVILSKDLVDETLILSDMYDLDEYAALELLCAAQRQMPKHPGLPRGLVAILLYYDGRKAIAYSLRDLFRATSGVSWLPDLPKEITNLISAFTQNLVEEANILERIVDLVSEMDTSKEVLLLTKNRAFGPKKHQNQVLEMFEDIKLALATALFNWSAQRGLPKMVVVKLLEKISKHKSSEPSGTLDDVTITMLMALLYSFDVSVLQRQDDCNFMVQNLYIFSDSEYTQKIYEELISNDLYEGKCRLDSLAKFAFSLTLSSLRHAQYMVKRSAYNVIEYDEQLMDDAIANKVFDVLYYFILEKDIIFKTEFFYRRIHGLFTDFIDFMHSKVTELRGRADETARTVLSFASEGLEPPHNLDRSFEKLLLCVGKLYKDDRPGLALCMEYWGPAAEDSKSNNNRSVSLFKFIRLAGELLPTNLFIPYLKMIAGLTSCEKSARNTFNLLKQSSGLSGSPTLSWEHFFASLARYYTNLRQEQSSASDTIYRTPQANCNINPQEIEGLHAVLEVIRAVAFYDEMARITICEHPNWAPLHILLGLLSCSVPLLLKAEILRTLAALGKSKETAIPLWNNLEASQIIRTIQATRAYNNCSLETEIEQNECRLESYPLTQGALELLDSLVTTVMPTNLGGGVRRAGFEPYLNFILESVFYKFHSRNYKNPAEKWQVARMCLKIFHYLLKTYNVSADDFRELSSPTEAPHPGFTIMLQLQTKTEILHLILLIIEETRIKIDEYNKFYGKDILEDCALHCLKILSVALHKQDFYFEAYTMANCPILITGMNKLLLEVNPRTKQPDYVLNIAKFITYVAWLPQHALIAIEILNIITRLPNASFQILGMFMQNETTQTEIRQGFVECLEGDVKFHSEEQEEVEDSPVRENVENRIDLQVKEAIIELLQNCLVQPNINLTHFLIGFGVRKDSGHPSHSRKLYLIDTTANNCLKSLLAILDQHLEMMNTLDIYDVDIERLIEKAYRLLYSLCSNHQTSDSVLRYLRSYNDFLRRHLSHLPFRHMQQAHVLIQVHYLLKCAAIELKSTASNCQITRFQNFTELLVGGGSTTNHFVANNSAALKAPVGGTTTVHLLAQLLDCFNFDINYPPLPKWDYFDSSITSQVLLQCELITETGQKLIDVKKLHALLNDELSGVQSTIASGQRNLIMQEIESVLIYALEINQIRHKSFATLKVWEAWCQVTEILFICSSEATMPIEPNQELILDIIERILNKLVPAQTILELSSLSSQTVLMLMVNLRCFHAKKNIFTEVATEAIAPSKSIGLSLRFILTNITEWIIAISSQKLRINLYAALVNCLNIVKSSGKDDQPEQNEFYISRLDRACSDASSESKELQLIVEVFQSFGEKLMDTLCNDSICGHDVCNMAALSCIDTLLDLDALPGFADFIAKRGYLSHILNGILKSDDSMCKILSNCPSTMKYLYIYESKMSMLLRLASSHFGVELLLSNKVLAVLSSMKVFDLHPHYHGSGVSVYGLQQQSYVEDGSQFFPTVSKRYQSILFPAITLCESMLSTMGIENHSVISQITLFLISHADMIDVILRSASAPDLNLEILKETAVITGLIARVTNQESFMLAEDAANRDRNATLFRVQRLMLSTFRRFIINNQSFKDLLKKANVEHHDEGAGSGTVTEQIKYYLQIASNLTLYCRNAIANHSADHRANRCLFTPRIVKITEKDNSMSTTFNVKDSLVLVINQLKGTVEFFNRQKSLVESLQRQKSSMEKSFEMTSRPNPAQIKRKIQEKQYELSLCSFITEQCLYLLWAHLDYYLRRFQTSALAVSMDTVSGRLSDMMPAPMDCGFIDEDVNTLKKSLISIFNETFCKQLLITAESESEVDKGFNAALLRRIKSLIQIST